MAIMSIMLSVVAAPMVRTVEATRFIRSAEAIVSDLTETRTAALLSSQNKIVLTNAAQMKQIATADKNKVRYFNLPQGWSASGDPIYILKSGLCLGGEVELRNGKGRSVSYRLKPPQCAAERITAPIASR